MNSYPNPDGPAPLSVLLEGLYENEVEVSFKLLDALFSEQPAEGHLCDLVHYCAFFFHA
jgi:hypothetical protein